MYLSKRNGIYYIFYRQPNGKKTCKSTGATLKKQANEYLATFKKELLEKQRNPSPTLNEFKKIYLDRMEISLRPNSWRSARNAIVYLTNAIGGDIKLNEITVSTLENILLDKFKVSKYSSHAIYRNLKAAFNKAVHWELIEKNPLVKIKLPKIETNYPAYITEDQLQLILDNEPDVMLKANYAIAFYTGMRLSEGLGLKWKDVDFINKNIHIKNSPDHKTKSKKERIVPFGNKVESYFIMLRYESGNDFIFSRDGKTKLQWNKVSKLFKAKVREAGLDDDIHYHSLRHSFASALVTKGVALYTVQKLLGHSSPHMTAIYSHLSNQSLIDAIRVLD